MVPLGLYLALHLMVFIINRSYAGDPIVPDFHWKYYGNEIVWGWMLLLVFFLFRSWEDLRETARMNRLRAEELEKERLQALLTKLKDQMNPHFLFNTLNTVASLIPADPPKAEQVVVKLSSLFQAILEATRRSEHSLKRELDFCRDYLDIEKARFGSRLSPRISIPKNVKADRIQVPVLLLQPLVENAVKHGISSRAEGGRIWIGASLRSGKLTLSVEDDGVGFGNSPYAGSGTALDNCRKRLELAYGSEGSVEIAPRKDGGTKVVLRFPVPAPKKKGAKG
jgi:LytS/YehU family sensor histidine kinase